MFPPVLGTERLSISVTDTGAPVAVRVAVGLVRLARCTCTDVIPGVEGHTILSSDVL